MASGCSPSKNEKDEAPAMGGKKSGFVGFFHFTFSNPRFPSPAAKVKIRWYIITFSRSVLPFLMYCAFKDSIGTLKGLYRASFLYIRAKVRKSFDRSQRLT